MFKAFDEVNFIFLVVGVAGFVAGANMRVLDPLLPLIGLDLGVEATMLAIVLTAYSFSYGMFQFVYGPLSEKYGKIKVMFWASVIAAIMSLISAQVNSVTQLTILRFFTGAGVGGLIPLGLAWVSDNTPYIERQSALARLIACVMLGTIFGPSSSGFIAQIYGWRVVFFMYFALFLINAIMLLFIIKARQKIDISLPLDKNWQFSSQLKILRDPWVRIVLCTVFLEGALFHGVHAFSGTFLQERFNLSISVSGLLVATFGVGAILYTFCVKKLVLIMGQEGLVLGGGFILFTCYIAMPIVPDWRYCGVIIFFTGFGFFMLHNTLQTCSSEMVPAQRGIALCMHGFSMLVGTSVGVFLSAYIIRVSDYYYAYIVSAIGLIFLASIFKTFLKKRNHKVNSVIEF